MAAKRESVTYKKNKHPGAAKRQQLQRVFSSNTLTLFDEICIYIVAITSVMILVYHFIYEPDCTSKLKLGTIIGTPCKSEVEMLDDLAEKYNALPVYFDN